DRVGKTHQTRTKPLRGLAEKAGRQLRNVVAPQADIRIQPIVNVTRRIAPASVAAHDPHQLPKTLGTASCCLGSLVFSQAPHKSGDVLQRIPFPDPDEYVPIHSPVEGLVQVADLIEHRLPKEDGLLQDIVGKVDQLPEIERRSVRKTTLDL